jgi:hypothetical protein
LLGWSGLLLGCSVRGNQQCENEALFHRFHGWLTPEQFGDHFGLSGNDIGKV